MTAPPPCAGKWELFDSTCPADHAEAAAICAGCPLIDACRKRLAEAQDRAYSPGYGPRGTWAGVLVGDGIDRDPRRLAAEERLFTADELRTAHADYTAGYRSPRTVMGERVYQRLRKRKRDRNRREVAA